MGLALVAGGTVVFAGIGQSATVDIVGACTVANVIIETYLASTSSGISAVALRKQNGDGQLGG